jgi:hypothetical protein
VAVSEETQRYRRRRDVIALAIHDAHCGGECALGVGNDGVGREDLDRAEGLILALDIIDRSMGYAPTCATCGVTVYWPTNAVTSDEAGPFHTNLDAADHSAGGHHLPRVMRSPEVDRG